MGGRKSEKHFENDNEPQDKEHHEEGAKQSHRRDYRALEKVDARTSQIASRKKLSSWACWMKRSRSTTLGPSRC